MIRKKICIITGTRAEWGLFYPLAKEIADNKESFILQIVSTGAHLSPDFGFTYKEIEEDGFKIDRKIKILQPKDTEESIIQSVNAGIKGLAGTLTALRPDLVILLGDRFEMFSAGVACLFLKIPVAHLYGGELTEGSLDDTLRHLITKMSQIHFVSTDTYRKRVIQMGEEPSRVFTVGALGVDNIKNIKMLDRAAFERKTGFKFGKKNAMVTFNPLTAKEREGSARQFSNLLAALDKFSGIKILFTKPNPDMYSGEISRQIDRYVASNPDRAEAFVSMGRVLYLSALRFVDVVIGNSSSGIIEAPSFGVPTVNIGDRQKGRITGMSIINSRWTVSSVETSIRKALSPGFRSKCKAVKNVYGDGTAAKRIVDILKGVKALPVVKSFYDINFKI